MLQCDPMVALVYDGDCGFCLRWVTWLKPRVQGSVEFLPFQTAASRFSQISPESYAQSIHLVRRDGSYVSGAAAFFELLGMNPRYRKWLFLYQFSGLFRGVTEFLYRLVANNRQLSQKLLACLWGPSMPFSARYERVLPVIERGIGFVYLIAFLSLMVQFNGLLGPNGILPTRDYLGWMRERFGLAGVIESPTLFWVSSAPGWQSVSLILGTFFAIAIVIQRRPFLAALGAWGCYLSWVNVGQVFLSYQWDVLLLQTGAILILSQWLRSANLSVLLYRLLFFLLVLQSGLAKIGSGDPAWRDLAALSYHFVTTPLPTLLGRFAHGFWPWLLQVLTALVLAIECLTPCFFWGPRNVRAVLFWIHTVFQCAIAATGNYGFFNLLAVVLSLSLWEDSLSPFNVIDYRPPKLARRAPVVVTVLWAIIMLFQIPDRIPGVSGWHLTSRYGLFAVMTTEREEILIEGFDGNTWRPYLFRWKPGLVGRRPPWPGPHMPRLDWQLWFASLGSCEDQRWLHQLLFRLLEGREEVLQLFENNPFPDSHPKKIRVRKSRYEYVELGDAKGWWLAGPPISYCPEVSF